MISKIDIAMMLNWLFGMIFSFTFMLDSYWRLIGYIPWLITFILSITEIINQARDKNE